MRRLLYMSVLAVCASSICLSPVLIAQTISSGTAIQTGFAVITPLTGNGVGLTVTETFGELVSGNFSQASVLPSPLVTLTNIVVNLDTQSGRNTGLAIVNPNDIPATIVLRMTNLQGIDIATRATIVAGRQQFSGFVSALFPDVAAAGSMTGFLFISSDITIAVLGLGFDGTSITALPVASQLTTETGSGTFVFTPTVPVTVTTPVAFATPVTVGTPVTVTTPTAFTTTTFTPATAIVSPSAFVFTNTFATPALPSTMTQLPPTIAGLVPTEPVTAITTPIGTTVNQVSTVTFSAAAINVAVPNSVPVIDNGIGGVGAFVLPQVAAGGGWVSLITIANTTATAQVVRLDFFNPLGGPLVLPFGPSIPSLVVPAGGVITISTAN